MKISNLFKIVLLSVIFLKSISAQPGQTQQRPECPAIVVPCQAKQDQSQQKPTILKFYIQSNVQQQQDFIEMTLTVKQKDSSLKKAIDKLTRKVEQINQLCQQYCKKNAGENCEERVQVNKFNVQPSYQVIRRQPNFNGFVVTNIIKIVVYETQNLGVLVDSLLGLGIYQIQELVWKPHVEIDATEMAIDAGIKKGNQLCRHINRKMGTVLSIEEGLSEDEEDDNKDEDNDGNNDEEQENQPQKSVLQFQIECIGTDKGQTSNKKSKEGKQSKLSKQGQGKQKKKK